MHHSVPGLALKGPTHSLLVLSKCRVDDTHVEKDLGRVRDVVELLQRLLKFVVVIAAQGRYPRLYFLNS